MAREQRNSFGFIRRILLARAAAFLPLLFLFGFARAPAPIFLSNYCVGNDESDDTQCIRSWIHAGEAPGVALRGSPGKYYYSDTTALNSNIRIVCADHHRTLFRNRGGNGTFLEAQTDVKNVHVEGCDFDVNGNPANFLAVISINPASAVRSTQIEVVNNRFYDSKIKGRMSAGQRQYVLLLKCDFCSVLNNELSEGGRIKVGQPGSDITIHGNKLDNVNDNAISVVDANGGGLSARITITNNHITNPKGIGIFLGADGESQTDPALITQDVLVQDNVINGNWTTGCIFGTLPATATGIRIIHNKCAKTGQCGDFAVGIGIKRVASATNRAQHILIDQNEIKSSFPWIVGEIPPLYNGGIFISGAYDDVTITSNRVMSIGPDAIFVISGSDVTNGNVTNNTMVKGKLRIDLGTLTGTIVPNTTID